MFGGSGKPHGDGIYWPLASDQHKDNTSTRESKNESEASMREYSKFKDDPINDDN